MKFLARQESKVMVIPSFKLKCNESDSWLLQIRNVWLAIGLHILSIVLFSSNYDTTYFKIFKGHTSFPAAPHPTCPPDKARVYCFVDPCQVTTCPAHPEAKCVSDFCGGCNARFFDDKGSEVTKSCSKYGYSVVKTEHRRLHHWPAIFFCPLLLCSIHKPSLPPVSPVFDDYLPVN